MSAEEVYKYFVDNGKTDADAQSGAAYKFWLDTMDRIPTTILKFPTLKDLSDYISTVYK